MPHDRAESAPKLGVETPGVRLRHLGEAVARSLGWRRPAGPAPALAGGLHGSLALRGGAPTLGRVSALEPARPAPGLAAPASAGDEDGEGLDGEERLGRALESAGIGLALVDDEGYAVGANRAFREILGASCEELRSRSLPTCVHADDLTESVALWNRLRARRIHGYRLESQLGVGGGRPRWVDLRVVRLERGAGGRPGCVALVQDITESKRIERALLRRDAALDATSSVAELLLRSATWEGALDQVLGRLGEAVGARRSWLAEKEGDGSGRCRPLRREWWVSDDERPAGGGERPIVWGFARWDDVLGNGGVIHGPVSGLPQREQRRLVASGCHSILVVPVVVRGAFWGSLGFDSADPDPGWSLGDVDALRTATGILGAAVDRARTEEALRETEERYQALLEQLPLVAYSSELSARGWTRFVSPQVEELLGFTSEEWLNDPELWEKRVHPDDRERVLEEFAQFADRRDALCLEYRLIGSDGRTVWVLEEARAAANHTGLPLRRGFVVDVTARKRAEAERSRLEAELRQSQKMEAVGQLVAGIAHDFNNTLTTILGNSELLLRTLAADDATQAKVEAIARSAERGGSLTRKLLAFSRSAALRRELVDLRSLIRDLEGLLLPALGEQIQLAVELAGTSLLVELDPGGLEQALLNLALNARDAMPEGGELTIEAIEVELGEDARRVEDLPSGRYARVTVTDTGCGMSKRVSECAFEPFFTTKKSGRGTGLGLYSVSNIVRAAGGSVALESEEGRGTAVTVHIPLAPVEQGSGALASRPTSSPRSGRGKTILLCEDERSVRELLREALEEAGYRVLATGDAGEALRLAELEAGPIDLLVTDLGLPGMGGRELAERLRRSRPSLSVIAVSGYEEHAGSDADPSEIPVLLKPFPFEELLRAVRERLAREA